MTYKVYDTCSLLLNPDHLFQQDEFKVVISSITLDEIENIKTAYNKDAETKYSARKLTKLLEQYDGCYEILLYKKTNDALIEEYNCELTNDMKIIVSAKLFRQDHPFDTVIFVTNDLCCKHFARLYFDGPVESYQEEKYEYDGYKEVYLSDEEMSYFYSHPEENTYGLYINQYLIVYNAANKI